MLLQRVARTIGKYQMLRQGDVAGVAVSGGADSVCLAGVLRALAGQLGFRLHILHLNHGLRGAESDGDAAFVASLAEEWGLPWTIQRAELDTTHGNLEQEARRARQRFFAEATRTLGLSRVATGHTLSDQAETVLFRLVRGSGPGGLAGILPVTAEGLIRPLLEVERAEVRQWLGSQGLWWREDSSNLDLRFRRNVLRQRILPDLEEHVRAGSGRALARLASIAASEEDYWRESVEDAFRRSITGENPYIFNTIELRRLHPALIRRVLRLGLERTAGSLRRFTQEHVERLLRLVLQADGEGQAVLPGVTARRSFEWLRLAPPELERAADWAIGLPEPGRASAGPVTLEVVEDATVCPPPADGAECLYNVGRDWLDFDRLSFPLILRNLHAGDTYQPVGRDRPVKLKHLMQSERVPSWNRPDWPMIVSKGRIVWARRFGAAAWAAAGPGTRRVLRVGEVEGIRG
ncbi:tRNA lysidine(34) synthetase TilS [Paludibaculum fermentans]|uniref:tRNA(Ile)-lysidine synthase n=1 Tax=Paludibaculum fermentans TaxID=1473598 RepID=A0A7S7NVM2_PALFE|nr:tRNA lysidine(34) synthetase TilS [Paludibaculum fermentans]QOY90014.1 tRNA lysidine(34) synthetase TilS [Paludibaculum fermentans]